MKYSFYHITDSHYYSKKNFDCDPWTLPQFSDQISFRESEEILKKALEIILDDKETSTVLFTGDLTNHGDKFSHDEMIEILSDFTEKGGRPFVFTDAHDYPWFDIFKIDKDGNKAPKAHLPREEVVPMYYPFGRDKAITTYNGDDTSYVAEIFPGLRYIAMGYDLIGNNGETDPTFSDTLMKWTETQIKKAHNDGCMVILGTHWPVVLPSPIYGIMGKGHTFTNGEDCIKRFADLGVRLFFSGHTHIQCIKEVVSKSGNKIYSVQTSALVGYPPKMRKIIIDTDTNTATVTTIDMEVPELNLDVSLQEYTRKGFFGIIESVPYNMEHNVEAFANTGGGITLPKDIILKHPKTVKFIGKKINGLTAEKMAKFSKKYHGMKKDEYAHLSDKKVVPFIFELAAGLYKGNQNHTPESAEYKITTGVTKKLDRIANILRIDLKKYLCGYSLTEIIKPLLYNSEIDDDNAELKL